MDDFEGDHGFQGVSEGGINRRQQNVKGWIWGGHKIIAEPTPYPLPPTPYPLPPTPYPLPPTPYPLPPTPYPLPLTLYPLPPTPYPLPPTPYPLPPTPYPLTPTPRQQIITGPKLFVSCKSVWVLSQLSTKLRRLKMLPVKYLSWLGYRVAFLFSVFDVFPPLHCCEDLLHWHGHSLGSPLTHP